MQPRSRIIALDATEPQMPAWPEPDMSLLENQRGEIQRLPLEVFPPAWRAWIEDTAQGAGAPVDYVALALLASTAAIVGCGMQVRATATWHEPLILWVAVVGGPSTGKSPALGAARRLLDRIELEMRSGDEARLREHSQCVEIANARTEKWQGEVKEAIKKSLVPPDMPADAMAPEPFVPRQMIVTDTTIEAVADILRGNARGIILWRDELSAWLGNMSRYSGGVRPGTVARGVAGGPADSKSQEPSAGSGAAVRSVNPGRSSARQARRGPCWC